MKPDIDSILLANWYLTMCMLNSKSARCPKKSITIKYIASKINKALFERSKVNQSNKAYIDSNIR
jgi:hypothetical protein